MMATDTRTASEAEQLSDIDREFAKLGGWM